MGQWAFTVSTKCEPLRRALDTNPQPNLSHGPTGKDSNTSMTIIKILCEKEKKF